MKEAGERDGHSDEIMRWMRQRSVAPWDKMEHSVNDALEFYF